MRTNAKQQATELHLPPYSSSRMVPHEPIDIQIEDAIPLMSAKRTPWLPPLGYSPQPAAFNHIVHTITHHDFQSLLCLGCVHSDEIWWINRELVYALPTRSGLEFYPVFPDDEKNSMVGAI